MKYSDFDYINYFTSKEIEDTGASIEDVQYLTINYLDRLRSLVGKPIKILKNGLTTGNHASKTHTEGYAVDFYVVGNLSHSEAVKVALMGVSVGFRGIGVYLNQSGVYSFHFDIRNKFSTWKATKNSFNKWSYETLEFNF